MDTAGLLPVSLSLPKGEMGAAYTTGIPTSVCLASSTLLEVMAEQPEAMI